MHAQCIDWFIKMYMHLLCMHNASTKSNDVAVRLSRRAWDQIGEFTKDTKLKKKQQVDVIVEEHAKRRKHLNGGKKTQ